MSNVTGGSRFDDLADRRWRVPVGSRRSVLPLGSWPGIGYLVGCRGDCGTRLALGCSMLLREAPRVRLRKRRRRGTAYLLGLSYTDSESGRPLT